MTIRGMPAVPADTPVAAGPVTFTAGHHFAITTTATIEELAEEATVPLSVILQVAKRCIFDCSFCSETLQLPDRPVAVLYPVVLAPLHIDRGDRPGGAGVGGQHREVTAQLVPGDQIGRVGRGGNVGSRHRHQVRALVVAVEVDAGLERKRRIEPRRAGLG